MAADLNSLAHFVALGLAAGVAGNACGQVLADPTRPPDTFRPPLGGTPAAPAASQFSSQPVVILSSDRRQVTINGQTVPLGGRIGDAKVIRISDTEVVLQSTDSIETIRLYGAVEKKLVKTAPEVFKGSRAARMETVK